MSQSQLDRAYDLIKDGRKQDALAIIEPLIRFDNDNDDAWWLLANATDDPAAKRDALNNVLRIGSNPTREEKARQMLGVLVDIIDEQVALEDAPTVIDDRYSDASYDDEYDDKSEYAFETHKEKDYLKPPRPPKPPKPSASGCATIAKVVGGIFMFIGIVSCLACFGIFSLGQKVITAPDSDTYQLIGTLERGASEEGYVGKDDVDAFYYEATAGETITFDPQTTGDTPILLVVYNPDAHLAHISIAGFGTDFPLATSTIESAETGQYLVIIRLIGEQESQSYTLSVR